MLVGLYTTKKMSAKYRLHTILLETILTRTKETVVLLRGNNENGLMYLGTVLSTDCTT